MIWCLLASANVFDARNFKIPNQLIGLGYITGLYTCLSEYGIPGIKIFCINAILPVLLLYLLFLIGGLGAGDIKLFSVMATMVGIITTWKIMILSVFLAGSVAIVICIKEQKISRRRLHYTFYMSAAMFLLQFMEECK